MEFSDFVNAVLHGGVLTLSIFVMLLALSVVTWGIIIGKVIQLRRGLGAGKSRKPTGLGYEIWKEILSTVARRKWFKETFNYRGIFNINGS